MLEGAEWSRQGLLHLPFGVVLFRKLVLSVEPQHGLGSHVISPKMSFVRQPRVDVMDQGTGMAEAPSVQMSHHVILPILQKYSHPCPQQRTTNTDVFKEDARGGKR